MWIILPAAAMVLLRLGWGGLANYRLHRVELRLRAAGVSTDAAVYRRAVPDDQNAAGPLQAAWRSYSALSNEEKALMDGRDKPTSILYATWTPQENEQIDQIIANHPDVMRLLDQAGQKPGFAFPERWPFRPDADPGELTEGSVRVLMQFPVMAAMRAHAHGKDAEALSDLHIGLAVARLFDQHPLVISHLVALGCHSLLCSTAERMEAELNWREHGVVEKATRLADDMDIASLWHERLVAAYEADPFVTEGLISDQMPVLRNWWLRPLAVDMHRRDLSALKSGLGTVLAPDWPAAKSLFKPPPAFVDFQLNNVVDPSGGWVGTEQFVGINMRGIVGSEAVRVLLLSRVLQAREGHFPASPDQIAARGAPLDPFASGGKPLHYRLDPDGPTVWSVGENGIDDGGKSPGSVGNNHFNQSDYVYGAAWRASPATPPATAK